MRVIGSAKEAIKRAEDAVFCIGRRARTGYCCGTREGMPRDYGRCPGVRLSVSTLRACWGACIGSRDLALRGQRSLADLRGARWQGIEVFFGALGEGGSKRVAMFLGGSQG